MIKAAMDSSNKAAIAETSLETTDAVASVTAEPVEEKIADQVTVESSTPTDTAPQVHQGAADAVAESATYDRTESEEDYEGVPTAYIPPKPIDDDSPFNTFGGLAPDMGLSDLASDSASVQEHEPEPEPEPEPSMESEIEQQPEPVAEHVAEHELEQQPEPETETVAESVAEPEPETVAAPETETVAEPVAETEPENVAEPVAEHETETETEIKTVAESVAEPETVAEPVAETGTGTEPEPLVKIDSMSGLEMEIVGEESSSQDAAPVEAVTAPAPVAAVTTKVEVKAQPVKEKVTANDAKEKKAVEPTTPHLAPDLSADDFEDEPEPAKKQESSRRNKLVSNKSPAEKKEKPSHKKRSTKKKNVNPVTNDDYEDVDALDDIPVEKESAASAFVTFFGALVATGISCVIGYQVGAIILSQLASRVLGG